MPATVSQPREGFSGGRSGSSFAMAGEKQDPPGVHGGEAQLVQWLQRPFPTLLVHFKIRSKVSLVFAREQSMKVPRKGRDIQRGVGHWRGEWFRRGTIPCVMFIPAITAPEPRLGSSAFVLYVLVMRLTVGLAVESIE
jgi:hypothetical protein